MPAQTHARGPDAARACREGEEVVHRLAGVLVIRLEGLGGIARVNNQSRVRRPVYWEQNAHLLHLPLISLVSPRDVVCKRLRPREVVVAAGRRNDVALAGDLAGEPRDGAGDWVGLASNQYLRLPLSRRVVSRLYGPDRQLDERTLVDLAEQGDSREAAAGIRSALARCTSNGRLARAEGPETYALGYCGMVGWKRKIPSRGQRQSLR